MPSADDDNALNPVAGGALTLISAALGAYYLALAIAHKLVHPPPRDDLFAAVALASSLAMLALALRNRTRPSAARRAHPILAGIAAVLMLNAGLMLAVTGEPRQTTNFILVQLGLASTMLSRRWFAGTSLGVAALWHVLAWRAAPNPDWLHFFFAFWAGALLSVIVFVIRRRTQLQLTSLLALDRRRLEAERATAEDMFRALVEQSLIGIVIIRQTRTFAYVNPKAAAIFGYSADEMAGLPVAAIAHPDDLPLIESNIQKRMSGEIGSLHYTFRGRRKDGSIIDLEVYGTRGQFQGEPAILGSVVDVTVAKRFARELAENERRLSTLLSNLPGIAYRCRNDKDWTMEFISEGAAALTGYTAEELTPPGPRVFNDVIHPDDRERVWGEVQDALSERRPFQLLYRIVRRDGVIAWVWEQGRGIEDERGETVALEGFITDITARMSAELELERSENRLRLALEAGELGIWDIDLSTGAMEWTDSFAKLYGLPPEPLHGRIEDLRANVHPADWPSLEVTFMKSMLKGGDIEMEFRVVVNGQERWLAVRGRRVHGGHGGAGRLTGWAQDITERKHFVAALETAKQQAEEANRLKSSILANMSHEIRTPMTAILGYADLLARKLKDSPYEGELSTIKTGGKRLLNLLNNVLDLARIEAGKYSLERKSHPADDALRRTVELFQAQAEKKGLMLELDAAPGLWVLGDAQAEEQIFTNVIGNAVKFTDAGRVSVSLRPAPGGAAVRIIIADTGIGISEAFMPSIFDEFRQESEGVGRRYEGSGLGLPIAKKLVESLNGRINVESRKNEGTVVTIDLPAGPAQAADADQAAEPAGAELAASGPPTLLVEDDEATGALVKELLAGSRPVIWARTAEEALTASRAQPFALVLLDIHLRGSDIDGVGLLQLLREQPAYRRVPIYAMTAYAMPGDRERFLSAGFDAYLAKPFEASELRRLVAEGASN